MVLLFVILSGLQIILAQEVVVGNVRTDGYQKITKGAYWNKRPVAKLIYNGSYPPGYNVYVLEQEYFVRFIDEEHNSLDCNYIVFPKGAIVYSDQSGQYYAAICGNKIEYIKPVENVKFIAAKPAEAKHDTVIIERRKIIVQQQQEEVYQQQPTCYNDNYYYPPQSGVRVRIRLNIGNNNNGYRQQNTYVNNNYSNYSNYNNYNHYQNQSTGRGTMSGGRGGNSYSSGRGTMSGGRSSGSMSSGGGGSSYGGNGNQGGGRGN